MNTREETANLERGEKQRHWDETARRIEQIVDRLGKHIDKDIREGIVALNALGINTTSSCEGHIGWGIGAPYIDVETSEIERLSKQAKELKEKGENEDKIKTIIKDIEHKNLEERRKLFSHLEEFYSNRSVPFHQRLTVQGMAWGRSRLESQGVDLQEIEGEKVQKQRLQEYQEEMREFILFLKRKYFGE